MLARRPLALLRRRRRGIRRVVGELLVAGRANHHLLALAVGGAGVAGEARSRRRDGVHGRLGAGLCPREHGLQVAAETAPDNLVVDEASKGPKRPAKAPRKLRRQHLLVADEVQRHQVVVVRMLGDVVVAVVVVMLPSVLPAVRAPRAPVLSKGSLLVLGRVGRQVDEARRRAHKGAVAPGQLRRRGAL